MTVERSPYKEVVPAPAWVWLTLATTLGLSVFLYVALREAVQNEAPSHIWIWDSIWIPSIAVIILVVLVLARLEISIDDTRLLIRFGFVRLIKKEISLENIEAAESISYRPIREFGGWGVRRGRLRNRQTGVYSIRGSTGVLVTLTQPIKVAFGSVDRVLIGTMDSARLMARLR